MDTKKYVCVVADCNVSFVFEKDLNDHAVNVHSLPVKCPYDDCESFLKIPQPSPTLQNSSWKRVKTV